MSYAVNSEITFRALMNYESLPYQNIKVFLYTLKDGYKPKSSYNSPFYYA